MRTAAKKPNRLAAVFTAALIALLYAVCPAFTTAFAAPETPETSETSGTPETSAPADPDDPYSGYMEYTPADISEYKRWTGESILLADTNYYIDEQIEIKGGRNVTLEASSRLLIKNGGSLLIYNNSSFTVRGELVVCATGNVTFSGTYNSAKGSRTLNYGTFSGTKSSAAEISGTVVTGNSGITVFSGAVNVYRAGAVVDYNRLTFSENSETTLTGELLCETNGLAFFKGGFSVTMNGALTSKGIMYLYCNMAVSGGVTLAPGSKYYRANGAEFKFTKSGTITDSRKDDPNAEKPPASSAPESAPAASSAPGSVTASPSEYDGITDGVELKGIDVSRYQGAIDWKKVKASGIDFVILRSSIGDGTTETTGEDIRFAYNAVAAKKAGLMVGAYHYLYAETVEDAIREAKFFIKTISPYALDFPAVLDFEDPSQQNNLTNAERTAIAKAFLTEVRRAGYFPMLYTNRSWAVHYLNMDELSEFEVWLAEWFASPSYTGDFGIWQYTARGKVAGIDGHDVDLDISYKNYRKMILDGGYNHLK